MKGGELIKCLDGDDHSKRIMDAYIKCLKYDSVMKGHDKLRIIMPPQQLVSFLQQT
jgi:hypothetical protein